MNKDEAVRQVRAAVDVTFQALMPEFVLVCGGKPRAEIQVRIRRCLADMAIKVYNLGGEEGEHGEPSSL